MVRLLSVPATDTRTQDGYLTHPTLDPYHFFLHKMSKIGLLSLPFGFTDPFLTLFSIRLVTLILSSF
jgi:hypothetical protein